MKSDGSISGLEPLTSLGSWRRLRQRLSRGWFEDYQV